jgi:2-polyprenyl-3-methyl-5-hydroxy-6-metoxy-1,4-benzoquinol methylase
MKNPNNYYNINKYSYGSNPENVHQKIMRLPISNKLILDVGCSEGYLGDALKKNGNVVYGIDISKNSINKAQKKLDFALYGNIETMKIPWKSKTFDFIICLDVLEHLFDPKLVIKKFLNVLRNDGQIIISLPNIAYYGIRKNILFGKFQYENSGILDWGHLRFYTYQSAKALLIRSGLNIIETDKVIYLPIHLKPFYKIIKKYFYKLFSYQFIFICGKASNSKYNS